MAYLFSKFKAFRKRRPWLSELFVFAAMFAIYFPLQQSKAFADPDSFYHLKMAELIMTRGPIRDFPWMPYTTLARSFADHHFLYHVALIPFIKLMGPLAGMKLATATMSAFALAALAWALRRLEIRFAVAAAIICGLMNPLVFRIGLSKASAAGVALLIIGTALAIRRQSWALGVVSFLYVWTHGGWPALLGLGTLAIIVVSWPENGDGFFVSLKKGLSPLAALWGGAVAGLVINPFFPQNLKFYWEQIVQIAVVNYQNKIGVGTEWYPYPPGSLLAGLPLLAFGVVLCLIAFPHIVSRADAPHHRARLRIIIALSLAAGIFLMMTLRSRRHVEYFVPLAAAACAAWLSEIRIADLGTKARRHLVALCLVACAAASMLGVYAGRGIAKAKNDLAGGYAFTLYQKATAYLKTHTAPGEVVVHTDWDDMPPLFYWDDQNEYIMGLDPTFMYRANPDRYWRYVNFTLGKTGDPAAVMDELKARYVISDLAHGDFDKMIEKNRRFERVYADAEAEIYLLK